MVEQYRKYPSQVDLIEANSPMGGGTSVPMEYFDKYAPARKDGSRGFIIEMGSGLGRSSANLGSLGFEVVALELQPDAQRVLDAQGFRSFTSDVRKFGDGMEFSDILWFENVMYAIAQGTYCNLADPNDVEGSSAESWKLGLWNAHISLYPKGVHFVSDMVYPLDPNPVLEESLTSEELEAYRRRWERRLESNREAGLPDGMVVNGNGEGGNRLEWGSKDDILELLSSPDLIERYIRYFHVEDFVRLATKIGFDLRELSYDVWNSSSGKPLSGFSVVLQKKNAFYYHPWKVGLRREPYGSQISDRDGLKPSPFDPGSTEIFYRALDRNLLAAGYPGIPFGYSRMILGEQS